MSAESDKFAAMAARIEHNKEAKFGGAAVIVPPPGGGDPIELLQLDEAGIGAAAQFWSTIQTRIKMTLDVLEEQQRMTHGFGGRR